jgi:uncharacterized spore protein YtfJ
MGFASGGLDYSGKKATTAAQNFGGGGGTGVTVTPVAFLVLSPDGDVKLLPVTPAPQGGDTVDKVTAFIERSPDLIEKLKQVFASSKKKKTEKGTKKIAVKKKQRAVESPRLRVGAAVVANGTYCYTSNGDKPHGTANNLKTEVKRIVTGRAYPILIGSYGWIKESDLQVKS